MDKVKEIWHSISLPKTLFSRIKKVIRYTGNQSVAEYVRLAILQRIRYDEAEAEQQLEIENDIKERLE